MNLESVDFVHPIYLPTQRNQTEVRALNHMKDSFRHPTLPDTDKPSWIIVLKANWVEISLADHVKERLETNAEKDQVACIPLTNVRKFVALPKKSKAAAGPGIGGTFDEDANSNHELTAEQLLGTSRVTHVDHVVGTLSAARKK